MKRILPYIIVLLVGAVIGWLCRPNSTERIIDIQRDTIVKIDTHIIEKPVVVQTYIKDSMLIEVRDTIRIKDSIYVALPREVKVYAGDDYYAEVSGYRPNLDYLEVYPKTTTITQTQSVTRCNALALGAELQYYGNTYIPIYLEYSHLLHRNVEMFGKILYDLPSQRMGVGMGVKLQVGW